MDEVKELQSSYYTRLSKPLIKGNYPMKFKVFFLTITIQKNKFSESEMLHERQINQAMDSVKERQSHYCSHL